MRLSSPLLALAGAGLAFAAGVAAYFTLSGPRDGGAEPTSALPSPADGAERDRDTAKARGDAGGESAGEAASEAAPPTRSVSDIVKEIRTTERGRGKSPERLLREILAKGGDEAILALANLLADPAFDIPNRAAVFADVLRDVADTRIADAARDVLLRHVDAGETDPSELEGYLDLVARHGGHSGSETLVALLEKSSGALATAVAASVAASADRSMSGAFLDLVKSGKCADPRTLFESMASWNDPAVADEMSRLAWNASLPTAVRGDAAELGSRALPAEALAPLAGRYAAAEKPEERQIILRSLSGFAANQNATPEALRAAALPLIEAALADPDRRVWRDAASLLREEQAYRTPETIAALESLAARLPEADARFVRQVLAKAKKPAENSDK